MHGEGGIKEKEKRTNKNGGVGRWVMGVGGAVVAVLHRKRVKLWRDWGLVSSFGGSASSVFFSSTSTICLRTSYCKDGAEPKALFFGVQSTWPTAWHSCINPLCT